MNVKRIAYVLLLLATADSLLVAVVLSREQEAEDLDRDVVAAAQDVGEIEAEQATANAIVRFGIAAVNAVVVAADIADLLDRDALDVGAVGCGRDGSDESNEDGRGVHFVGFWLFKKSVVV